MECIICYNKNNVLNTGEECEGTCCDKCSAYYCTPCVSKLIFKLDTYKCAVCRTIVKLPRGSSVKIN